jgi:hypothetical protein
MKNKITKFILQYRCLVAKLRRLEKEIFLLKKEEDWQNEELLSSEIRSLEKQVSKKINYFS